MWSLHGLWNLFREGLRPLRAFLFNEFLPLLWVCRFGAGGRLRCCSTFIFIVTETGVSSCALSFHFLWMQLSFLPFNAGRQVSLHYELSHVFLFQFFRFWPQSFGFWASDPCISSPSSSTLDSSAANYFAQFLVYGLDLIRATYAHLVQNFQNIVWWYLSDRQQKFVPSGITFFNIVAV